MMTIPEPPCPALCGVPDGIFLYDPPPPDPVPASALPSLPPPSPSPAPA